MTQLTDQVAGEEGFEPSGLTRDALGTPSSLSSQACLLLLLLRCIA